MRPINVEFDVGSVIIGVAVVTGWVLGTVALATVIVKAIW